MRQGKIANPVLKRSVLKMLAGKDPVRQRAPEVGQDAACVLLQTEQTATGQFPVYTATASGLWPVWKAANHIYAEGGIPQAAQCSLFLPQTMEEMQVKDLVRTLTQQCARIPVCISGGQTQACADLQEPLVSVTMVGTARKAEPAAFPGRKGRIPAGAEVVMTKWAGLGGMQRLVPVYREQIRKRYAQWLCDAAEGRTEDLLAAKEAEIAWQAGALAMHAAGEGGIYAALWDLAERCRVGLQVEFTAIPVLQEAIEVCELLDVNPYELDATGSLLVIMPSGQGQALTEELARAGILAAVIGYTTEEKAKVLENRAEVRYLDLPKQDQWYVLQERKTENR